MNLLSVASLLVLAALLLVVWQLSRIETRLRHLARQLDQGDSSSVHDTSHPVFSIRQLRRARQRFEDEHRNQLRLEAELYGSDDWPEHASMPSPRLRERLRTVCEAIVQSECAWREYVFMVEGNLSVANGGESRARILEGLRTELKETRGTPVVMTVTPNAAKVRRVDELLANWAARLGGETVESVHIDIPDLAEEGFDYPEEEAQRISALLER